MADHVRKQIRARAGTVLAAGTAWGKVFVNRSQEVQEADLPAVLVMAGDEEVESITLKGDSGARQQRTVELVIWAVAQDARDLDDTVDAMIAEVETLIFADFTDAAGSLGALCKSLELVSVETDFSDGARQPVGDARIAFAAEYHTAEGAPTAVI